jgi:hypothetical protein
MQTILLNILHIVQDIHNRRQQRKNNKPKAGDKHIPRFKKTKAKKERNKNEYIFNVVMNAEQFTILLDSTGNGRRAFLLLIIHGPPHRIVVA